jgi:CBS domain containing-hemolysin-like protein
MITVWLIIITLIFSAFFSGTEIAFVSSSRLKQELDMKRNIFSARILSDFYKNPSRFIGALLLGNNIALVVYGMETAKWLEPVLQEKLPASLNSEWIILLSQTVISTLIILVIAEFLPKILFRINPNAILKTLSVPVWIIYYFLYPLIVIYIGIAEFILRKIFRVKIEPDSYTFSAVDLDEYVKDYNPDAEEKPESANLELQMIQNAMEFKHVKLRDCMVPRTDIDALEKNENIDVLIKMFIETGHSKIMIYSGTIDNLQGYVHAYDMFKNPGKITDVLRKVNVYPETMAASDLLGEFIKNHKSVAVVVDEFGGTSGIVTMEDIIEEIFGEIEDEYDKEEELEKQLSENEYLFSARLEIDYLNEKYKLDIPVSEEYETLAGFIIHYYKSIPAPGDEIETDLFKFKILKASGNRLEEVKMTVKRNLQ